jgi:hypothetical protein
MVTNLPKLGLIPNQGFTLFIQRGPLRLNLCYGLESRDAAVGAAHEFAELRFVGLQGMFIRCEDTGEQWLVESIAEVRTAAMSTLN